MRNLKKNPQARGQLKNNSHNYYVTAKYSVQSGGWMEVLGDLKNFVIKLRDIVLQMRINKDCGKLTFAT